MPSARRRAPAPRLGPCTLAALLAAGCTPDGLLYEPEISGSVVGTVDLSSAPTDDLTAAPPSCTDGRRNGDESDVDCGGTRCPPCGAGLQCGSASDCQSRLCDAPTGTCVACNDGVKDGHETGVDCGGADCGACDVGEGCAADTDCLTRRCDGGQCVSPISCATIKAALPDSTDGAYTIDPDGAGAAKPFQVWCDMTTSGGGWTALPLDFTDPTLWSVSRAGQACTSVPKLDAKGQLLSFQNASANGWGYLAAQLVPAIPVRTVWLKGLVHSTATQCNNMDLLYTVAPSTTGDTTAESWYFAGADPTIPLGFTFADGCTSPLYSQAGQNPPECSMQTTDSTTTITRTIKLAKQASRFTMVAVQGCGSSVCDPNSGQAERFYINHPPSAGGLWKDGILVR